MPPADRIRRSLARRSAPPVGAGRFPHMLLKWPIRPFDTPHKVRATFGEPRGLVGVPQAAGVTGAALAHALARLNQMSVPGRRIIHHGIDIQTHDGSRVYAVTDGVATIGGGTGYGRWVQVGDFRYVHLDDTVREGTRVRAGRTVLGTVYEGQGHVHLTRFHEGQAINPLAFGSFVAYEDRSPPVIGELTAMTPAGVRLDLDELHGPIGLCVRAHDVQSQGGFGTGLYRMSYTIFDENDEIAVGPYELFRMDQIPLVPVGNLMYTVSSTRHKAKPVITYRLTLRTPSGDGYLRTRPFAPGPYRLRVSGADVRGNRTARDFHIRIIRPPDDPFDPGAPPPPDADDDPIGEIEDTDDQLGGCGCPELDPAPAEPPDD